MSENIFEHTSVLQEELAGALSLKKGQTGVDCTAGGGGHLSLLLKACGPEGKVYGIDRDPAAIRILENRFERELEDGNLQLLHGPFSQMIGRIPGYADGIAADFGVSSPQLDQGERGFSFMKDGPLDMRMNPQDALCAEDVIRESDCDTLTEIFKKYGEEPQARSVAKAIVRQRQIRPITRTTELAELVKATVRYKSESRKHPATRIFQALRMYVNSELEEIEILLDEALKKLRPGRGRLGVITFHSLEDRMVKNFYKKAAGKAGNQSVLRGLPLTESELRVLSGVRAKIIKPFPLIPSEQEVQQNPRARSAKLRVLELL